MASITPKELRELRLRSSVEDLKNLLSALEEDGELFVTEPEPGEDPDGLGLEPAGDDAVPVDA